MRVMLGLRVRGWRRALEELVGKVSDSLVKF